MYKIVFTKNAHKEYVFLYKTNKRIFEKIRSALQSLSLDPHIGKPLKLTLKGKWSYRVGIYRIIYSIDRDILRVCILDIGHRREIYR